MVVVVLGHVPAGLVQHGEQRAQAAQAREVHDVLHLGGVLQGFDHQAGRGEVRLQDRCGVPLDLQNKHNLSQQNLSQQNLSSSFQLLHTTNLEQTSRKLSPNTEFF